MNRSQSISLHLQSASLWILRGLLFLFPLFFLPFTLDPLEINKQTFFLIAVCSATILRLAATFFSKDTALKSGWSHWVLLATVVVFSVSAWFSYAPYTSWIGSAGSEYTSVLTWIGFALLFYVCSLFQKNPPWGSLLSGAAIAGLLGLLSVFGISFVPFFPSLSLTAFNTVGTLNALAIFLVVTTMFAISLLITSKKQTFFLVICLFFETLLLLFVLDYALLWVLLLLSCLVIFIFALFRPKAFPSYFSLSLPVFLGIVSLMFWLFLSTPFSLQLPKEVTPSFGASSEIMNQTLRDHAWFGTGQGTYAMNHALYHSRSLNETDFWNTRFDRAASFMFTLAPGVGYLGIGIFLLFLLCLGIESVLFLAKQKKEEEWVFAFCYFVPWIALVIASFLFSFNMTLTTLLFLFSGLLAAEIAKKEFRFFLFQNKLASLLYSALFIIFIFGLFIGIFFSTGRYAAEMAFTHAIRADRTKTDLKKIVTLLDRAATLNQFEDDYVRNLSQALLMRVQEELKIVSPNAPLTEASKKYVQALVAASVNASARATELSPYATENWLARADGYRSLIGLVDDASKFALEGYERSIKLEPQNPNHWNELGKTNLLIANELQKLTVSEDQSIATKAKSDWQNAISEAEKDFEQAIALKSNFAPAHYQLALVYEREGKLNEAIGKLESVFKYNEIDVGVGFELGTLYAKRAGGGDIERAQNMFEHVVALAPSYSDAHWFLASMYEKLGKRDDAIKEIEIVLKLNPDNKNVRTRLERLKNSP